MSLFDLTLPELELYRPARSEPADFDAFWRTTLDDAAQFPLDARFKRIDHGWRRIINGTATKQSVCIRSTNTKVD